MLRTQLRLFPEYQVRRYATRRSRKPVLNTVSLTLFAKEGCALCDKAKVVLTDVLQCDKLENKISFTNVDITDPLNKQWWDAYCFDVPVLHIDRYNQRDPVKMMHYLNVDDIVEEVNKNVE